MHWTKAHDILLCREVLALEPYKHNLKSSNEAGKIWTDIAQSPKNCQQLKFKQNLSQRAVRERFSLLQARYKEKEREEIRASGISPEQDELDVPLEEITERRKKLLRRTEKMSIERKRIKKLLLKKCENKQWKGWARQRRGKPRKIMKVTRRIGGREGVAVML